MLKDGAQRLDNVLELRDLVDQLAATDLPKGFDATDVAPERAG
jgi:hypothetical protein